MTLLFCERCKFDLFVAFFYQHNVQACSPNLHRLQRKLIIFMENAQWVRCGNTHPQSFQIQREIVLIIPRHVHEIILFKVKIVFFSFKVLLVAALLPILKLLFWLIFTVKPFSSFILPRSLVSNYHSDKVTHFGGATDTVYNISLILMVLVNDFSSKRLK